MCTVDSGITMYTTDVIRLIVNALYEACQAVQNTLEWADEHDIWLPMPWGQIIYIKSDGHLNDFSMPAESTRYWAVQIGTFVIPLPRSLGCIRSLGDVAIPGSELNLYIDPLDLHIKQGRLCTPEQNTTWSDVILTSIKFKMMYEIVRALHVLGFLKTAAQFVSNWWWKMSLRTDLETIIEKGLSDKLELMQLTSTETDAEIIRYLKAIKQQVGARLLIR